MNSGDNCEAKLGPLCNSCHTAKTRYDWSIKKRRRKTANSIKPIKRNLKAGPEMRTKFTCPKCRAGLIAVGASWGKIKGCPKCSSMISVRPINDGQSCRICFAESKRCIEYEPTPDGHLIPISKDWGPEDNQYI